MHTYRTSISEDQALEASKKIELDINASTKRAVLLNNWIILAIATKCKKNLMF